MADTIKMRRDTKANWTAANPVLANGELGFETDTKHFKMGNGSTAWNLLEYYDTTAIKADNWYVASRANIVFNESSVKIGDGYLYFRKGNTASLNINHAETTYSFSGTSHLCLNLNTKTISIKSTLETGDIDLIYYDGQKGFCYGLLFDYYLNNKINEVNKAVTESIVQNVPISTVNTLNNQYITSSGTLANSSSCKVVVLSVSKGQTVIFETVISNSAVICITNESTTSFTPAVIQPSVSPQTRKRYEYYADEDCYVALSGRTSDFWFSIVKYFIPTFAYLDNKTNEIAKADNWYVASHASITFNESSVKIGDGYLYFRKGNFTLNINHIETTYSFSGTSHLCLNLDTKTISIKSTLETGDIDLIYYDGQKGFCYGLLFDYYLNNKAKADNWYVASRANIVFNESSVKIGDGYLYFRKGNTASLNINHIETTYSFSGTSHLCLNLDTKTISIKSTLETGDIDLIYYDGQKGFCYGLLFDYYLNNKIDEIKTPEIVPSFVFKDGMEAYQRIISWANNDSIFLLGFITDVHSGGTTKYIHNNYLSALGEPLGFDILCNGGDIGLDTSATPDTHSRFEMMYNTKRGMIGNVPWVYIKGNHERLQSMAELGQIYNKSFNSIYGNFVFGDIYGLYGYRDYVDKKIRIIFLNTSDNDVQEHYSMSATQLQWLSNTLLNTPSNYGIVVLTHRMIDSIGRWKSNMSSADGEPWDTYRSILKDFVARASGSGIDGVTWDFSTADGKLVCNLAGDSHFNSYVKRDGVNYIVRQGMQNAGSEMQGDATAASFDWKTKTCLDSLAIKKDGTAKIFRIGAGGSDYDLSFTY